MGDESEPTIDTFKELMDHISYDWDTKYALERYEENGEVSFQINKTYIDKNLLSYKTSNYKITNPNVFWKLEEFWKLLQVSTSERTLFGDNRTG